jgi:shikimate kinase
MRINIPTWILQPVQINCLKNTQPTSANSKKGTVKCDFDIDAFETDIEKSLYFESSIPQGYGVGSSGALVAALFEKYVSAAIARDPKMPKDRHAELKRTACSA